MISEMEMLSAKEKLSNSEKKRMVEIVEELNGKMTGLNLVYDDQKIFYLKCLEQFDNKLMPIML